MKNTIRVLIAEDSRADFDLLARELQKGFDPLVSNVDSLSGVVSELDRGWDIIILDYLLPGVTAIDILGAVRERDRVTPVIIVSGVKGEEAAVHAMQSGAQDYILKGNLSRLVPAIEREVRESLLRKEHRKAEERIKVLNRTIRTTSRVNQMIVRETDRDSLLAETCRILVEDGGFAMAWIGFADGEGSVVPAAWAGSVPPPGGGIEGPNPAASPMPVALFSGKPAVCRNIACAGLAQAAKHGFTSSAAFPLIDRGVVAGSINVYSSGEEPFGDEVVKLLEELAANISYALMALSETSERKMAVAALRDSEERLRTIFESAMDGMFVLDMNGRHIDVNVAGCHMFGYSRDEVLASDSSLFLFRDNLPENRDYWKKDAFIPEFRMRKKDGTEIWVDMAVTHFSVSDRMLALCIKRDISDRKRAEEDLLASEERFHQIFEQSDDAQMIFRYGTSEILEVNPAAIALYGWRKKDILEKGPALFMGDGAARFEKAMAGLKDGKGFRINRTSHLRKDGSTITVSVKARVVMLKNSVLVYCTFKDLTEKMKLEDEARLIQAKLIHANKMTSIGTLASGVAHEINNPNNFILFNSTLLCEAWNDALGILEAYYHENGDFSIGGLPFSEMKEVVPELLTGITDGSRRIKGIVDNLRDFSRVDKSGMDGEVDLNGSVVSSAAILTNQIAKHTSNFTVECREGLPFIKGNRQKIDQVVINLVMNALHALPDKERGVRVETSFDIETNEVVLKVADEGTGMTREVLERVTEPFFTTRSDRGGTGLGLSISYSIIKEHGGTLEFDSCPGSGTTVTVRFPAK